MVPLPFAQGRVYAVVGLARSGMVAARALAGAGARVSVWDDGAAARDAAAAEGLAVVAPDAVDWPSTDALVLSPGVPLTHPRPHAAVVHARDAGIEIIGDIELLWRAVPDARYVGITGTNGKSTTTTLLGHILTRAGMDPLVGGNLGPPVLAFDPPAKGRPVVLEVSSYQCDLIDRARFETVLLLNLSPDHLDRHGDMAGYIAAKRHLLDRTAPGGRLIIGTDDTDSLALADTYAAAGPPVWRIGVAERAAPAVWVDGDGTLHDRLDGDDGPSWPLAGIATLPGSHNWQNAAAAYAAARALGVPAAAIAEALCLYPGLAHRQERVAVVDGILFVNDSKATNADAASRALSCYDRILWIAGGRAKAGGIAPLAPLFRHVEHAFLIGEAAADFAATLAGRVPFTLSGDIDTAVDQARAHAAAAGPGTPPVVLLSPACASFDQFRSFEARGDAFRAAVTRVATTPEACPA